MKQVLLAALIASTISLSGGCVDLSVPEKASQMDGGIDARVTVDAVRIVGDGGIAPLVFDFESTVDDWHLVLEKLEFHPEPTQTTERALKGQGALRVPILWTAKDAKIFVGIEGDTVEIGLRDTVSKVTFNIWLPPNHKVGSVQAFIFSFDAPLKWQGINNFMAGGLREGGWTRFELSFPDGYAVAPGLSALGFELIASASWAGVAYIDDVVVEFVAR